MSDYNEKLIFRRQYFIGYKSYTPTKYWHFKKLNHGLVLSIHEDLSYYSYENNQFRITLIGIAVDCTAPGKKPSEIVSDLMQEFDDIHSVIKASKPLSGRWILICQDLENTYIFSDPCGSRQLYYHSDGASLCCASQPALINQVNELTLTQDELIWELRNHPTFKKKESLWIGSESIYEDCYHLLPNHYFDWDQCSQIRFFPNHESIPIRHDLDRLIDEVGGYIKNIMHGLNQTYHIKLGLSAGFDSRLLLAATADFAREVTFITDSLGILKNHHADVYVPKRLAKKLNLGKHVVMKGVEDPPDWFYKLLSHNVTNARVESPVLPKIKSIYKELIDNKANDILAGGNALEIVRVDDFCYKYDLAACNSIDYLEYMVDFYHIDVPYARKQLKIWLDSMDLSKIPGATIFDMFHWEQEMGNWGAQFYAEFDIAAESISPFNCRLLLETCLAVPKELRRPPETSFFKDVIGRLWPAALNEPINPGSKGFGLLKEKVRTRLPAGTLKVIQQFVS